VGVIDEAAIGERFRALAGELDERRRRLWAAAEARSCGYGGIAAVARATGMSEGTIRRGLGELASGKRQEPRRVRRAGGGRRPLTETDPTLLEDLERLLEADTRGDPEAPLRWTAKSVRQLAAALRPLGEEGRFASMPTTRQLDPTGPAIAVRTTAARRSVIALVQSGRARVAAPRCLERRQAGDVGGAAV
jgi:hypothetical protein